MPKGRWRDMAEQETWELGTARRPVSRDATPSSYDPVPNSTWTFICTLEDATSLTALPLTHGGEILLSQQPRHLDELTLLLHDEISHAVLLCYRAISTRPCIWTLDQWHPLLSTHFFSSMLFSPDVPICQYPQQLEKTVIPFKTWFSAPSLPGR